MARRSNAATSDRGETGGVEGVRASILHPPSSVLRTPSSVLRPSGRDPFVGTESTLASDQPEIVPLDKQKPGARLAAQRAIAAVGALMGDRWTLLVLRERYARSLKRVSEWFERWGSHSGAMHVRVRGRNAQGEQVTREWMLVAEEGDGPYVPTLAATALVLRLAAGRGLDPGARPCVGCMSIAEVLAAASGLAITAGESASAGMFQHAMGPAYARVDPAVRAFHALQGRAELRGEVETEPPGSALAALLAAAIGAPRLRTRGALRFELECAPGQQGSVRGDPGARAPGSPIAAHGPEVAGPALANCRPKGAIP